MCLRFKTSNAQSDKGGTHTLLVENNTSFGNKNW